MKIDFDPDKSARNAQVRGLPFDRVIKLDWTIAQVREDLRNDYPERRFVALAPLQSRLHVVCFTPITDGIRVISFRKANLREVRHYANR